MRQGRWPLVLLTGMLCGCTTYVTRKIEHPGHDNRAQLAWFRQLLRQSGFQFDAVYTQQDVRMAYWYGQPRAYGAKVDVVEQRKESHFDFNFKFAVQPDKADLLPVRGSVILLHPWGMEGAALTNWALLFASAGYVVMMPDLRSHGASGDAPVGYGPREASEVVDLATELRAAKRLPGPLYLLGVSYGGTVALFVAPKLAGVHGVVAMEPYANAAGVIRRAPASGLFGPRWLGSLIRPREVDNAIQRAGQQLGIDLAKIDPGEALARTPSCVLILRGSDDNLIAEGALRALSQRSSRASYVDLANEGHLALPMRTDRLISPMLEWMQALSTDQGKSCPAFVPLPVVPVPATSLTPSA